MVEVQETTLYLVCSTYYTTDEKGKRTRHIGAPLGAYTKESDAVEHKWRGNDLEITALGIHIEVTCKSR